MTLQRLVIVSVTAVSALIAYSVLALRGASWLVSLPFLIYVFWAQCWCVRLSSLSKMKGGDVF